MILADIQPIIILLIVIGAFAAIAIVAFIIYRLLRPKLKDENKEQKTEQDYAQEELDRILQPVEDEEVAKEISDYKQNDDESEEEIEENADKIEVVKIEHQQCFNESRHWPIVSIMIHYRDFEK